MQPSTGFPEIDADAPLDWNSQASGEASTEQASFSAQTGQQSSDLGQPSSSSLIWESAGLVPRLKLPVLVHRDQASSSPTGRLSIPCSPRDMPCGPSVATARVRHPFSSTESAALAQLRAELNCLFAEAHRGPDLSLVPLPRQLNQAAVAKSTADAAKVGKLTRPNRLQPRASAAVLRRDPRRRYTAEAAVSVSATEENVQPTSKPAAVICRQPEAQQDAACRPAADQDVEPPPARSEQCSAGETACVASESRAASGVQTQGRRKAYGRSNSWAAGCSASSSPTRQGITQNGVASTSGTK